MQPSQSCRAIRTTPIKGELGDRRDGAEEARVVPGQESELVYQQHAGVEEDVRVEDGPGILRARVVRGHDHPVGGGLCRLDKAQPVEEEVYLGEVPIMIGGGEFIINGSERVTVSQLHRSPGVDFSVETHTGEKKLHSCWIIPERGSWIEINVTKKDAIAVRIDQSGKFPCATLVRALDEKYSSDEAILKEFYATKEVKKTWSTIGTRRRQYWMTPTFSWNVARGVQPPVQSPPA